MLEQASAASVGERVGVQVSKTEHLSETVSTQDSWSNTHTSQKSVTASANASVNLLIVSFGGGGGGSYGTANTEGHTRTTGNSRTTGATEAHGHQLQYTNLEVQAWLAEIQRIAKLDTAMLEVEVSLHGDLARQAPALLASYRGAVFVTPSERLVELGKAGEALDRLVERLPARPLRAPRLSPPDGNLPIQILGTDKELRIDPGALCTVTGPHGSGKTYALAAMAIARRRSGTRRIFVLDGLKRPAEQEVYARNGFDVTTPRKLSEQGVRLLDLDDEAREALADVVVALVPGGGPFGGLVYDAFSKQVPRERDSLEKRLQEVVALTQGAFGDKDEITAHVVGRLRLLLRSGAPVLPLVSGAPCKKRLLDGEKGTVICLGDLPRTDRALFVLCFLLALRFQDTADGTGETLVVLDEMKAVFGGRERERRPESLTEDTSPTLLAESLEGILRTARQRRVSLLYADQCLRDVPSEVRERAGAHLKFYDPNSEELALFASLCGVADDRRAALGAELAGMAWREPGAGQGCLVGGPVVGRTYGEPYISCKVKAVLV